MGRAQRPDVRNLISDQPIFDTRNQRSPHGRSEAKDTTLKDSSATGVELENCNARSFIVSRV